MRGRGVLKSTIEHLSNCNVTNQHQKLDSILKKYIFGCAALVPVLVITQIVQYILKYNIILIKIVRGPSGKKKNHNYKKKVFQRLWIINISGSMEN